MSEKERFIAVSEDDDGQRLDRWLKKNVPAMPYGLTQKLVRKGAIKIDGKKAKGDAKLVTGQAIRIPPFEEGREKSKPKLSDKDIAFIKSLVFHDDGDVIALNKPSGLAVQGGSGIKVHVDGFLDGLVDKNGVRPKLVHRLDKDTSGVLLLARSSKMAKQLGRAFKGRDVKKIYLALTHGVPEMLEGTIKAPLIKAGGLNRERMRVDEVEGKMAITEYMVIDRAMDKASFMAFWPRTGRTHQIRVHAEIAGFPILGDNKYRGEENQISGGGLDLSDRLHLHAYRIILEHPAGKGILDLTAPLPGALKKSWAALGFDPRLKNDPFQGLKK